MKHLTKNKGVGLIEVLVTTLVIAFGLLAVAVLQGKLMEGSGSNKTRAEAKALCETKVEQLRDAISKGTVASPAAGTYNAIAGSADSVVGSNETFARTWTVTNITSPESKKIDVACTWGSTTDDDHRVMVQSIIAYDNSAVSLSIAEGAGANTSLSLGSPSTNAGSSDDTGTVKLPTAQTPDTVLSPTQAGLTAETGMHVKVNSNGTTGTIFYYCDNSEFTADADIDKRLILFENGLYTRRIHLTGQGTGTFKESIELFKEEGTTNGHPQCSLKVRYNGGIIIPMKGRVYVDSSADLTSAQRGNLGFNSSESGVYCAYTASTTSSFSYSCYIGGKCSSATAGTHFTSGSTTNTIATECPSTVDNVAYPSYDWVGAGGWRGKVGLLGLITGNDDRTSCFAGTKSNDSTAATAREYYSLRSNSVLTNEGINKPYLCHDFLIVGTSGQDNCTSSAKGALNLASKTIVRAPGNAAGTAYSFTGTTANLVDLTVDKSSCHIIEGSVPDGVTAVTVTKNNGSAINGKFDCTVNTTADTYNCTGTSQTTDITVAATAGGTETCDIPDLSANDMTRDCDLSSGTTRRLTTVANGNGTVSPSGITSYPVDSIVTVTATPSAGYVFSSWAVTGTGTITTTCSGTTNPCTVKMSAARSVTATFACSNTVNAPSISWSNNQIAWGDVSCATSYVRQHCLTGPNCTPDSVEAAVTSPFQWVVETDGQTNCYTIKAVNANGTRSAASNKLCVTRIDPKYGYYSPCSGNTAAPAAPSIAWVNGLIAWNDVSCATGYVRQHCLAGPGCTPDSVEAPVIGPFQWLVETDGQTNCYTIKATNVNGNSAASNKLCVTRNGTNYTFIDNPVSNCTMPTINGLSDTDANSALTAAGFTATPTKTVITTGTAGTVSEQNPTASSSVICSSAVSYNYTIPATCTVNITGSANNKDDTITANGAGCTVSNSKGITCSLSGVATGNVSVVSVGSANATKFVAVTCSTQGSTVTGSVSFP